MAETNFKNAVIFSKKYIPQTMRRLILANDDGLLFLGRENLQSMLDEWALIEKASKVMLSSMRRMNREYGINRPTDFYSRQAKLAEEAQAKIRSLLDLAESKPLLCDRRISPKIFAIGESVYASFAEDECDVLSRCTVTGYKNNEVIVSVEVYDEDGNETLDEGTILCTSEYLFSESDMKYLVLHPEYFSLFVSYLKFDEADAQTLYDMLEDCAIYYFPEIEEEILRLIKEAEEESGSVDECEPNTSSETN